MEELGFTCASNCFYRQVNDVLQTLTLSRMFNFGYELKFNILPLCIPISKALPSGIMGPIESFEDGQVRYFCRNYTKHPEKCSGFEEQQSPHSNFFIGLSDETHYLPGYS